MKLLFLMLMLLAGCQVGPPETIRERPEGKYDHQLTVQWLDGSKTVYEGDFWNYEDWIEFMNVTSGFDTLESDTALWHPIRIPKKYTKVDSSGETYLYISPKKVEYGKIIYKHSMRGVIWREK